ncbi:MAG TPA: segregation/condensation protein A, partial [Opitutales bacterium]|nr:segregation/condensation protein A [Opitutales bacterium]
GEEPLTAAERPLKKTDKLDLWQAFNNVLRRLSEKLIIGEIRDESVTVSDQMEFILEILEEEKTFSFSELFEDRETTSVQMLVATFLGILELVRLDQIKVWQNESFSEIYFTGSKEKELEMDAE